MKFKLSITLIVLVLVFVVGCGDREFIEYEENKTASIMDEVSLIYFSNNTKVIDNDDVFCIVYYEERFIICNGN